MNTLTSWKSSAKRTTIVFIFQSKSKPLKLKGTKTKHFFTLRSETAIIPLLDDSVINANLTNVVQTYNLWIWAEQNVEFVGRYWFGDHPNLNYEMWGIRRLLTGFDRRFLVMEVYLLNIAEIFADLANVSVLDRALLCGKVTLYTVILRYHSVKIQSYTREKNKTSVDVKKAILSWSQMKFCRLRGDSPFTTQTAKMLKIKNRKIIFIFHNGLRYSVKKSAKYQNQFGVWRNFYIFAHKS